MPELILASSKPPQAFQLVDESIMVGRHTSNSIVIDDASVSGHHAEISRKDEVWTLRDLRSSNGTELNGRPIEEAILKDGDEILFGAVSCRFLIDADAPPPIPRFSNSDECPPPVPKRKRRHPLRNFVAAILVLVIVSFVFSLIHELSSGSPAQQQQQVVNVEQVITKKFAEILDTNKQPIFKSIHPIGTAKSIKLHEATFHWKNGINTNQVPDILSVDLRYTIYWDALVTQDGYTKLESTFDMESGRFIASRLLATNGTTNKEFGDNILEGGAALLQGFVYGQMLREAAQQQSSGGY